MTNEQKKLVDEWERVVGGATAEARRVPIPLSPGKRVKPNETVEAKAIAHWPFRPERFFVSDAGEEHRGPWWKRLWPWYRAPQCHGAADWIIVDVTIDGKSQFAQAGALPGDMFNGGAIDSFVAFDVCPSGKEIVVKATYVGQHPRGQRFLAGMIGTQHIAAPEIGAAS